MPRFPQLHVPTYRLHRATGQAIVNLDGKDHYLGRYNTPESRTAYERIISQWMANGRKLPSATENISYTVGRLSVDFLLWARNEYKAPDGTTSRSVDNVKAAMRPLAKLFYTTPISEFGPKSLVLYRQHLIDTNLARSTVNDRVAMVRRAFKWGVAEEKVPPSVFHGLLAISGLKRGRCGAREAPPVTCVPQEHIDKTLTFAPPPIAAMVQLQLLTAARPGEIVILRMCDIDKSDKVWLYKPHMHKNAWRGHERIIAIGPRGQEIINKYLRPMPADSYLFSPLEAERRRRARLRALRVTPLFPSHLRALETKRRATPERHPRDRYDVVTYARAITRACERARVPVWSPERLRHNAATEARRRFGLEAASALLGHRLVETTQVYAELSRTRALQIAAEVG